MTKCKWCGQIVGGSNECLSCWRLRCQIEANLKLAGKILFTLRKEKKERENASIRDMSKWMPANLSSKSSQI